MALILSIETSTDVCSVALHHSGQLVALHEVNIAKSHVTMLMVLIKQLLDATPYKKDQLAAVGLGRGPGSYTGLRVGAAVAKGLCYGLQIPLIAVDTLTAMAHGVHKYNIGAVWLCPMLDACGMGVYCQILDAAMRVQTPAHTCEASWVTFSKWLSHRRLCFFGNGVAKCEPVLVQHPRSVFINGVYPTASHVGELACKKLQQGEYENPSRVMPLYVRYSPIPGNGATHDDV